MNFDLRLFVLPENEDSGDEQMKACEEDIGTVGSFFSNRPVDAEAIPGSMTLRTAALARQLMVGLRPGPLLHTGMVQSKFRGWGELNIKVPSYKVS